MYTAAHILSPAPGEG